MSGKPRILHVFKTAGPESMGGIPTVMHSIAHGLADRFDSEFLISSNRGAARFERHLGLPVSVVRHFGHVLSLPIAPTFPLHLRLKARQFDMIALHAPFPLADLAGYLDAFRRTPLIVHWHAEIVRQTHFRMLYTRPMRKTLSAARAILVSGDPLVQSSDQLRAFRDKCHPVPFGIDVGSWNQLSTADRDEIRQMRARHPRLVLAVGRLVSYKGLHILIDAMRHVDGELWIVGDGPLGDFLRRRAERRSGKNIRFLGEIPRAELRRLYHAARVLAFPSITNAEAFGLVQLEAMACGLPVVNTTLPTMVPVVARHQIEALSVPPGDELALAGAITRVLDDNELARSLGEAAHTRAASAFSERGFLDKVGDVYQRVLSGRL